ncbi:hypothetical protein DM02DRAFT_392944 [Periconia macrospinosa]|uniref:Uncharacterized protein n=1 Tax=Periconia macrospinosa TaxID=97972 RepID=A0A2V1DQI5_9PLEO|nr:hypothetical protein DM02DRAFT_392944 [Periconia macrospinosa]
MGEAALVFSEIHHIFHLDLILLHGRKIFSLRSFVEPPALQLHRNHKKIMARYEKTSMSTSPEPSTSESGSIVRHQMSRDDPPSPPKPPPPSPSNWSLPISGLGTIYSDLVLCQILMQVLRQLISLLDARHPAPGNLKCGVSPE